MGDEIFKPPKTRKFELASRLACHCRFKLSGQTRPNLVSTVSVLTIGGTYSAVLIRSTAMYLCLIDVGIYRLSTLLYTVR